MTHHRTIITFELAVLKNTGDERTSHETQLELSHKTKLNEIVSFEKDVKKLVKKAIKATLDGHYVFADITKATYSHEEKNGCVDFGTFKTEKFEMWSGRGDMICEDGIHFTPSEQFNDDIYHDIFLIGRDIFSELSI